MKFFNNKKDSQTDSTALAFDFGTSSVKILACRYGEEGVEILGGKKVLYPKDVYFGDGSFHPERAELALKEGVNALLAELQLAPINRAAVGISNGKVEGYSSKITYRRANSEKKISDAEYQNILKLVENRADQIMRRMISWELGENQQIALISSEILDLTLDGYSVTSVTGSTGTKLEFIVYNGYAERSASQSIMGMLKGLGLEVKITTPTIYSALRNIADSFGPDTSACLIDMGDKVSEVGIILSGRIMGHIPFDVAGGSFTKNIANALDRDEDEAAMLKLGFAAGKIPKALADEIHEQIATDCKVFVSGVELILSEFPGVQQVPPLICLCGGGSVLPGVLASLQSAEWKSKLVRAKNIRVQHIKPEHLKKYSDVSGKLGSPADIGALSVAIDSADLFA